MNFIQVSGIGKKHERGGMLRDISFEQSEGERVVITGASGSGKTTLLRILAGWLQPDEGAAWIGGARIRGPLEQLMPGHPGVVYLSQHFELPSNYRVEELLDFDDRLPPGEAEALYRLCRIDHLRGRKTGELSGGEKQRIALARLLVATPRVLLLDEPFSNLDQGHKARLKDVINELESRLGLTILLVSHDPLDILPWAHRVLVMQDGRLVQEGRVEDVYRHPADEYVASLLGPYSTLSPELARLLRISEEGRSVIVRPEQLRLCERGAGPEATVRSAAFTGPQYELLVEVEHHLLRVYHERSLPSGASVAIAYR